MDGGNDLQIQAVTFNIHHGRGIDGKLNLNRIVEVLEDCNADVIGLNEVDRHFAKRSEYLDQVSWIAKQLNMHHAFGAAFTLASRANRKPRQYGNALLSRYPIRTEKNHLFDFYSGIIEGRALLETILQVQEQIVTLYVTHLSLNPILHAKQTDYIMKKIMEDPQPVILLGDWNMKPGSKAWKKITGHLTDVCRMVDNGPFHTFPSFRPRSQLDYIFASHHFRVSSAGIVQKKPSASDHLPLLAKLTF